MLILQIALGIVLGVFLLTYLAEIFVLGIGAIILIALVLIFAVIGMVLYQIITLPFLLASLALIVFLFLIYKFYNSNWYLKRSLKKQIKVKEDFGYECIELKEKLYKIEIAEEDEKKKLKLNKDKKRVLSDDFKKFSKLTTNDKAKEIARRRSLGYDK